jgi:hypothetical protein
VAWAAGLRSSTANLSIRRRSNGFNAFLSDAVAGIHDLLPPLASPAKNAGSTHCPVGWTPNGRSCSQAPPPESSGLFPAPLLAERYERASVMLTSNLPFSQWEKIFKDAMTTAAAIDRLVHHSVIIELNLPSYRAEQAKKAKGGRASEEEGAKP